MNDKVCMLCGFPLKNGSNVCERCKYTFKIEKNPEMVNHPKHYNMGKYEVKDVIRDWNLNFALGSVLKYVARCENKGNKKQDLEKAMFFLQDEIDNIGK